MNNVIHGITYVVTATASPSGESTLMWEVPVSLVAEKSGW